MTSARPQAPGIAANATRAAMSNAAAVPFQAVLSVCTTAVTARALDPVSFGLYAIFNAVRASLLFYTDLGTSVATARLLPEALEREGRVGAMRVLRLQVWTAVLTTALLLTAGVISEPVFLRVVSMRPADAFVFRYALIGLIVEELVRVPTTMLWARLAHVRVNRINIGAAAVQLGVITMVALAGGDLHAILVATLAVSGVRGALLVAAVILDVRRLPHAPPSLSRVEHLNARFFRLAASSWVGKLSGYVWSVPFLTLLVATRFDKTTVGLLALAAELTTRLVGLAVSPMQGLTLPTFSSLFANADRERRQHVLESALRVYALILLPLGALVVGFSPFFVPLVYSSSFAAAVPLLQIVALFQFAEYTIYPVATAAIIAREHLRRLVGLQLLSLALLPVLIWGTSALTVTGVAGVYGAARFFVALAFLRAAAQFDELRTPAAVYLPPALVALALATPPLLVAALAGNGITVGIVALLVCLGLGLALVRALGCLGPREVSVLRSANTRGGQWILRLLGAG